ncbi:hypothetical protein [Geofilum rhodophaeum]|uniref:hypothetical protein n=1 Tax=Geofilum rhodophaeum TaxID=1965019 RepID=UPI000B5269AA|nr:hypothetical protein [Geofilum rhodophaeum]
MKQKIFEMLRARFSGTQTKVLDRVAEHLSQTVTEESQLETAIAGVQPLVTAFTEILQSETDRRVTEATSTALKNFREKHGLDENGKPISQPSPPANPPAGPQGGDDVPAWAKGLIDSVTTLKGTVESVTKKTTMAERQAAIQAQLKAKGVSEKHMSLFASRVNLESENLEGEVERVASEYTAFRQDLINEEIAKGNYSPANGFAGDDESFIKQMDKWGDSLTEKK